MTKVILPYTPVDKNGKENLYEDVYEPDLAIAKVINGELDNENLKAAAGIVGSKLAEKTIEEKRLADAAVTSRKFKPTVGLVAATENLVLSNAYADVPGAVLELTPAVASKLLVTAIFEFQASGEGLATSECLGTLGLDAADQTKAARLAANGYTRVYGAATVSQTYVLTLTAAAHTIKMRAKYATPGEAHNCMAANTQFSYLLLAA